jgi:hypothetical protein
MGLQRYEITSVEGNGTLDDGKFASIRVLSNKGPLVLAVGTDVSWPLVFAAITGAAHHHPHTMADRLPFSPALEANWYEISKDPSTGHWLLTLLMPNGSPVRFVLSPKMVSGLADTLTSAVQQIARPPLRS